MARGGSVGNDIVVVEDRTNCVLQMRDAIFICFDDVIQILRSVSSHVLDARGRTFRFDTNATTKVIARDKVSLDW